MVWKISSGTQLPCPSCIIPSCSAWSWSLIFNIHGLCQGRNRNTELIATCFMPFIIQKCLLIKTSKCPWNSSTCLWGFKGLSHLPPQFAWSHLVISFPASFGSSSRSKPQLGCGDSVLHDASIIRSTDDSSNDMVVSALSSTAMTVARVSKQHVTTF